MSDRKTISVSSSSPFYFIIALCTAIIGYQIHHSAFWAIMDFLFWPFAWLKWVICKQVSVSVIKAAFGWFLK